MTFQGALRALAGAALAAALLSANPAAADETLTVGKANPTSFVFALIDVGQAAGIFGKHGLTLDISAFGGGPKLQQAMAAGSVDIGMSTGADMALAAKGAPVKAVASILNGVDQVIVVSPKSGIASADDLKGKTFAASSPAAASGWLPTVLATQKGWGADGVKLQIVNSSASAMALLETGQIDAMTIDPANALNGEKAGTMKIVYHYSELLSKFPQYAFYATNELAQKRPDALKGFLAAWLETVKYAKANKDETVKVIQGVIGMDAALVGEVYDKLIGMFSDDGRFDAGSLDVLLSSFVDNGVLEKKPAVADVSTDAFLP
jgi:NitT/TauT family transport system substrate-binding protein